MTVLETIRLSKNTSVQWLSLNPILADKEIGVETDTRLFKVGDGINHWQNLAYVVSGYRNALFISLSTDADNLIGVTSDGSIILHSSLFNGLVDYQAGKDQGLGAIVPQKDYNYTILKIGQDMNNVFSTLSSIASRLTVQEAKLVGDKINDVTTNTTTVWSSSKITDFVLATKNALKADITSNPNGAYDALTRLAQLLADNSSLAVTITNELAGSVRHDFNQNLTLLQQAQARLNIDTLGVSEMGDTSDLVTVYTDALASSLNSPFESNEL
jgi:hypothetical protein